MFPYNKTIEPLASPVLGQFPSTLHHPPFPGLFFFNNYTHLFSLTFWIEVRLSSYLVIAFQKVRSSYGCGNCPHYWVCLIFWRKDDPAVCNARCELRGVANIPFASRGTGYIGSFTTLALLEHGYEVVIVDSLYNSSKVSLDRIELLCGKRPTFYQVDVTDEIGLEKVFAAHPNLDSVIHFAALKVRLPGLYEN